VDHIGGGIEIRSQFLQNHTSQALRTDDRDILKTKGRCTPSRRLGFFPQSGSAASAFNLKNSIVADYIISERAEEKNESGLDLHEKKKVQIN
jgi:hypothetical protein